MLPEMFNDVVGFFFQSAPSAPRGSPSRQSGTRSPNKLEQTLKSAPEGVELSVSTADVTEGSVAVCHGQTFLWFVLGMLLLVSGATFVCSVELTV